jgi:hypothetical protein
MSEEEHVDFGDTEHQGRDDYSLTSTFCLLAFASIIHNATTASCNKNEDEGYFVTQTWIIFVDESRAKSFLAIKSHREALSTSSAINMPTMANERPTRMRIRMGDSLGDEFYGFEIVLEGAKPTTESPHRLTFVTYIVRVGRIVVKIVLQWPSERDQKDP